MSADCQHATAGLGDGDYSRAASAVVIDLCAVRLERLTEEIAAQLIRHRGAVTRRTSEVVDVDLWRRAARRAGRVLQTRVRTGVAPDGSKVWVVHEA